MESSSASTVASAALNVSSIEGLFKWNKVTRMASVETLVVLTTLLLVARFLLDFLGPWYGAWSWVMEVVNYSMVHYTMGTMQLSAAKVNDYFQVWAVLLVTLQYSVKAGHPYSRSKKAPLLDLMSSFWAANLLRVQTFSRLRASLWMIWSLNAARTLTYFAASEKAEAVNQVSLRITADYMSYEHEIADAVPPPPPGDGEIFTMDSYKYLVLGEDQVVKDLQDQPRTATTGTQRPDSSRRWRKYQVRLDPQVHEKLITLDKIWKVDMSRILGCTEHTSNQLKDVCLSFSLYKLLRRRFYDLPLHEAGLKKISRLVFRYILSDAERAFRVVGTELSFLQDLFYSRRAATFASGFPTTSLVLSLLLVAATGYVAYPIRYVPEREEKANIVRSTHGVLITRLIVALIAVKELAGIYMYVFSQWTEVLMLCNYATRRWLRHPLAEGVMRVLLTFINRGQWDDTICQHNILISTCRTAKRGTTSWQGIRMETRTKESIFRSIKRLEENPERLGSYLSNAFEGELDSKQMSSAILDDLEADTHRILVWHIATCLCEIKLASNEAVVLRPSNMQQRPFVDKKQMLGAGATWANYTTAASLSNYCAYLVTQALVPDSGLVARNVLDEVRQEIRAILLDGSMEDVCTRLMYAAPATSNTLTGKGTELARKLMVAYGMDDLWEKLADFWTGFLLHLAVSTRASKHRTLLAGRRELTTHLWALLSHAGFLGRTSHGQATILDPVDRLATQASDVQTVTNLEQILSEGTP
ncbi:hypothetical protein HU200_023493 [Digitaria exilis]|uniref:DUF4220 domain-containing protein n=1 Tax=Digitaria exilis TaxID=1010633 RepID=A0A835EUI0_9POAL|nr:hypothetical protein HU200_023493 [Digitaria exilis]